ncbi:DoxX family protein, partial [Actinacidiphila glaucinigra]
LTGENAISWRDPTYQTKPASRDKTTGQNDLLASGPEQVLVNRSSNAFTNLRTRAPYVRHGPSHEVHPAQGQARREAALGRRHLPDHHALYRHRGVRRRSRADPARRDPYSPRPEPLAPTGLAVTMLLAALTHVRRKEPSAIVFNAVLLTLVALQGMSLGPDLSV